MNSTYRAAAVVVMVIILLANPALLAWGNPVPGRWEKAMQTLPGEKIVVYTKDGAKQKYFFVTIEDDLLTCANEYESKIQIELAAINKIIVSKAGKYAKNGALWGAVGGAGVMGFLAWGTGEFTDTGNMMWTCVGAVLGAGGGYLTGAAVGAPGETVYISEEAAQAK